MPHQCTDCSRVFDDGSKEMLSGCPNCGGNKFQFKPAGADAPVDANDEPPEPAEPATGSSVARTVGKTAATVRDLMGSSNDGEEPAIGSTGTDPLGGDDAVAPSREDTAQASARTDVVSPDELPSGTDTATKHRFRPVRAEDTADGADESMARDGAPTSEVAATAAQGEATSSGSEPAAQQAEAHERPDLEELRAELNDQFESIKVLNPGQYELNLMELYDREEYIVALQEDGRYSIQVPENFRD